MSRKQVQGGRVEEGRGNQCWMQVGARLCPVTEPSAKSTEQVSEHPVGGRRDAIYSSPF